MNKEQIRIEMNSERTLLSEEEHQSDSNKIIDLLKNQPEYIEADVILTYVSFGKEVNTYSLIQDCFMSKKVVAVPKIIEKGVMEFFEITKLDDLQPGKFGILESVSEVPITYIQSKRYLMIMPGLAFDRKLHRIGYGGGYYDRYLSHIENINLTSIALAFDFQIYEEIPSEDFDYRPNMIITPSEIIKYDMN